MNQIKIIKRGDLQSPPERSETEMIKVNSAAAKRQAMQVVAGWIDEWRAAKPKDAKRAFADLFGASQSTIS
jgi:hypothetical protein